MRPLFLTFTFALLSLLCASSANAGYRYVDDYGANSLNEPRDVAVSFTGDRYVADTENRRIVQYSFAGQLIRTFSDPDDNSIYASALDVAPDGTLFATDGNRIHHFDSSGTRLSFWDSARAGASVRGLAVDEGGDVYVAHSASTPGDLVEKYDSYGTLVASFGAHGSGPTDIERAISIAVANGVVSVADPENERVQQYNTSGGFLRSIPVAEPTVSAVATDTFGSLYIARGYTSTSPNGGNFIERRSPTGDYITQWGLGEGSRAPSTFNDVFGLDVAADGTVVVADSFFAFNSMSGMMEGNGRIQDFRDDGRYNSSSPPPPASPGETPATNSNDLQQLANHPLQRPGPVGMVRDGAGDYYVAYSDEYDQLGFPTPNPAVHKYSSDGSFIASWPVTSDISQQVRGITLDRQGNVVVLGFRFVQQLNSTTGALLREWGTIGEGAGQLSFASQVLLDGNGYLAVLEPHGFGTPTTANDELYRFNANGELVVERSTGIGGPTDGGAKQMSGTVRGNDILITMGANNGTRITRTFDAFGTQTAEWTVDSDNPGINSFAAGETSKYDCHGNLYLGKRAGSSNGFQASVVKFGSGGSQVFSANLPQDAIDVETGGCNSRFSVLLGERILVFGPQPPAPQPPTVTITKNPDNPTEERDADFEWDTTGVITTTECRLDSGAWESCTDPNHYDDLSYDADHTFEVRVSNPDGSDTDSYTWHINDQCAPAISSLDPNKGRAGDRIVISGARFGASGVLHFTGVQGSVPAESWSSTQVTARVPDGAQTGPVTVDCGDGTDSRQFEILVDPQQPEQNLPPTANIVPEADSKYSIMFTLDGSMSIDLDGEIVRYEWRFGGKVIGKERILRHRFPKRSKVLLRVWDDKGATGQTTVIVQPKKPPVIKITIPTIHFCFDCDFLSPKAKQLVKKIRRYTRGAESVRFDGHTDWMGSVRYNWGLSKRRATTVRKAVLRDLNPRPKRVITRWHSELRPVASNRTSAGRARNRRVEVTIHPSRD